MAISARSNGLVVITIAIRNLKMTKPLCPDCGKGMYRIGLDLDPSVGLQTEEWQCYSLNPKHKLFVTEPIPGWDFRTQRNEIVPANGRRLTEKDREKIISLIKKGLSNKEVAIRSGWSIPTIHKLRHCDV